MYYQTRPSYNEVEKTYNAHAFVLHTYIILNGRLRNGFRIVQYHSAIQTIQIEKSSLLFQLLSQLLREHIMKDGHWFWHMILYSFICTIYAICC